MDLSELKRQWKEDCQIDRLDIENEIIKNANLHSKYIDLHSESKLNTRKAYVKCQEIRKLKYRYYKGLLDKHELKNLGWEQYQGKVPLKTEMNQIIDSDHDYLEAESNLVYYKTIEEFLESVVKQIYSRTFEIKNLIEWRKFESGI